MSPADRIVWDESHSPQVQDAGIAWADDKIDALFDLGADRYSRSSKMPMQRITTAEDRRDLMNYLRAVTQEKDTE